ncbi:MAG: VOC family protein [Armatimonadota bacterium]|nr:VOC family protein [bacterium]
MIEPHETFNDLVQVGVVVSDVDATIKVLSEVFGLGPFRVFDWPSEDRPDLRRFYHGEPADFTARMAFAEIGPIELELIQPMGGPSVWGDYLKEHGPGIHHIRFNVDEYESVTDYLKTYGIDVAQSGDGIRPGTQWANLGTEALIGFGIEIFKKLPGTNGRTPQKSEIT